MAISDTEIIERIHSGAKYHYALLVNRYSSKAFTLSLRMLKNREDAEEAAQDAFIRAYNALDKFEGAARFSTWFYRILYNVCLTRLGNRKRKFTKDEYDDETNYQNVDGNLIVTPDIDYDSKETIVIIKNIIDTMPEKYSTILSMFYFQDLSHHEICEVMQLPLGTVKTHLFRARAILQKRLAEEFESEIIM